MISVGFVGAAMIANQQTTAMNDELKNLPVYARYENIKGELIPAMTQAAMDYDAFQAGDAEADKNRGIKLDKAVKAASDAVKAKVRKNIGEDELRKNIAADGKTITDAFNTGGRAALSNTSILPVGMAICFLGLLVYYKSIGGYKVLTLGGGGDDGGDDDSGADESGSDDDADPLAVTTVEEGAEECCGGDEAGEGGEGDGGG